MIILDIETTGFNPKRDKIIEVAALKWEKGKIVDQFSTLVNPIKPIPTSITRLTGLSQADLTSAPLFKDIELELFNFMKGHRIYGYNVAFDKRFLVRNSKRFNCFIFKDYLKFIKKRRPNYTDYKMKSVAKKLGIRVNHSHRAVDEVNTLWEIMRRLGWA